jgi:hypothetical protein
VLKQALIIIDIVVLDKCLLVLVIHYVSSLSVTIHVSICIHEPPPADDGLTVTLCHLVLSQPRNRPGKTKATAERVPSSTVETARSRTGVDHHSYSYIPLIYYGVIEPLRV